MDSTMLFAAIWLSTGYEPDVKKVGIDFFTPDNGYEFGDDINLSTMEIGQMVSTSFGYHIIMRIA